MPNFDALRTSTLGALSYICRPKVKPAELLALFPFSGDLTDLSNYGRTCSTSSYSFTDDGPFGTCVAFTGSIVHTSSAQWSIDFYANFANANVQQMNFNCTLHSSGNALYGGGNSVKCDIISNTTFTNSTTGTFAHFALTYDGTKLSGYCNGVRQFQQTGTLKAQTIITSVNKANLKLSNLRVVGKCLTTGPTFPVPSDFYTGYETL